MANDRRIEGRSGLWRRDSMARSRSQYRDAGFQSQIRRMEWRAAGAQFYPGGAYEDLSRLSHRGKGPKGYTRTDELLHEIICEQLTDDPFIDASDVTVEVRDREVTLHGTVRERRQKYAIEDLVADVAGVTEIHNHLSVASDPEDDDANV
jgi:osmotically-inducible protein OsmY